MFCINEHYIEMTNELSLLKIIYIFKNPAPSHLSLRRNLNLVPKSSAVRRQTNTCVKAYKTNLFVIVFLFWNQRRFQTSTRQRVPIEILSNYYQTISIQDLFITI